MNPTKEILDQFEVLKIKFERLNEPGKNGKTNIKSLTSKDYELALNQLMNYFNDLIIKQENISLVLQANLDLKVWNLLSERISKIIKYKIEPAHLGKNYQLVIQNLYSTLIEDLRNSFIFFRNVYSIITNYEQEKDINILISNVLTFMGDLKKLKLILNKKFDEFKDSINMEGDSKKDSNDSLRFFNYALNNNPYNTRIYSNLGFVYREFLEDFQNSAYWFIRALSCVDNDMKKLRDNLEKDFNSIRKKFLKIDYIADTNIGFLKYDLDYLPTLFYRIMGTLFMNIDIDDLENLLHNFTIIIGKILQNYTIVPDAYRLNYEINGHCAQMAILGIFNFHFNLNNLTDYSNQSQKIITQTDQTPLLNFGIYNHNILKDLNDGTNTVIKNTFKISVNFIHQFTKCVCTNIREDNLPFVEKYLLILFYWLSLNYDVYCILIDEEISNHLKFLNFYIQNDPEMKKFFMPQTQVTLNLLKERINNNILPIEMSFIGFLPLNRFFVLNKKNGTLKVEDIKEISIINKLILIHFMDSFSLTPENNEEIALKFAKRGLINIKETFMNPNDKDFINSDLREKLMPTPQKTVQMISLNIKKIKPLILLDASNIAMRHGEKTFSSKGIQIVMDYFMKNGHKVLSFLPEYLFRSKDPGQSVDKKKRVVPDDIGYLNKLFAEKLVLQTPPQDYDDSYCIQYAKQNNAYIVTNDMFRDYLENITDNRKRETEKMCIKEKLISFTFNKDEFLPNPDAAFFKEFNISEYSTKAIGEMK